MSTHTTKIISDSKQLSSVRLYRVVFVSLFSRFCACIILLSFILQPLARAQANEEVVTDTASFTGVSDTVVDTPVATVETSSNDVSTEPVATTQSAAVAVSLTENVINTSSSSSSDNLVPSLPEPTSDAGNSDDHEVPAVATTTVVTGTDEMSVSAADGGASADIQVVPDTYVVTVTATTSSTTPDLTVPVSTVQSDSQIQFDKSDCVAVGDGSFYCQPKKPTTALSQNGFFALPDSDGDLEIFMQKDGQMTQITHNTIDDAAPVYDSLSQTIVWHRLIDDRYQIMSYDVASGIETQLTADSVNNMEPNRAGSYTVWQHWNNDNWDVVLFDGKTTKILTTSLEHDIAPSIRGTLVVWSTLGSDTSQTIELYDITSGEYTTINDTDGGVISNPRMVLVYESLFENGDVVTKGYDMLTGEVAELATVPVQMPDEIPPPDSTGETRALIQAKSNAKEEGEVVDGSLLKNPSPDPVTQASSSTSTVSELATTSVTTVTTVPGLILDLRAGGSVPIVQTTDIVIPSFVATSSIVE
jgi:hypothetical protein